MYVENGSFKRLFNITNVNKKVMVINFRNLMTICQSLLKTDNCHVFHVGSIQYQIIHVRPHLAMPLVSMQENN